MYNESSAMVSGFREECAGQARFKRYDVAQSHGCGGVMMAQITLSHQGRREKLRRASRASHRFDLQLQRREIKLDNLHYSNDANREEIKLCSDSVAVEVN